MSSLPQLAVLQAWRAMHGIWPWLTPVLCGQAHEGWACGVRGERAAAAQGRQAWPEDEPVSGTCQLMFACTAMFSTADTGCWAQETLWKMWQKSPENPINRPTSA